MLLKKSYPHISPITNGLVSVKMILDEIKSEIILIFFPSSRVNQPSVAASSSADRTRRQS